MKKIINAIICVIFITLIFCGCGTAKKSSVTVPNAAASSAQQAVQSNNTSSPSTSQTLTNGNDNASNESSSNTSTTAKGSSTLSNSEIRALTLKADSALSKAFSCNNVDCNNPINKTKDNNMFQYGRSLNYTSKKQIEKDLSKYFDENNLNKFADNMTLVQNNKLYILIGQEGMRPDLKNCSMKVKRARGEIQVNFSDGSGDGKTSEDKTLIYEHNKWLFKDLWYTD